MVRRGAERKFSRVVEALRRDPRVTIGDKRGFGSGALKVNDKIFAMTSSKGEFVVKLPRSRIDELLASGTGKRFEPRPGRVMKEWLVLTAVGIDWIELANQARDFVKRGRP
ncbi:MAG TPA: hypothetical protein VEK33_20740 [Terriglobales bacterium]|nr:hypothetical protein [Terriglobales bacterium]